MIKVKVLRVGKSREIEIKCPRCLRLNWIVTDARTGIFTCWHCASDLEWEVTEEELPNWDLTRLKGVKGE